MPTDRHHLERTVRLYPWLHAFHSAYFWLPVFFLYFSKHLPLSEVADAVRDAGVPDDQAAQFWEVTRENITTLKDLQDWWTLMRDGAEPVIDDEDREFVAEALALLPEGPFDSDTWGIWTTAVKEATGRKGRGLFMPLRKALTGQSHGPDMSALMPLLQTVKARG